jgi:hypothetical protein
LYDRVTKPLVRKLQVFVSSTYLDLRSERQAAVTAILENGHIPAGMELFAAGNEEQLQVIHRWIDESDVFMLILGRRYGSLEPKTGLSYTELEYEYARNAGKPFFAIVLNESFISEKVRKGQSVDELVEKAEPEKLKAFRSAVTSRMSKFVEDEKDIRLAVAQSIRDLEGRHDFVGWISGRDAAPNANLLADLGKATQLAAALQEKNTFLEKENQKLKTQQKERGEYEGRSFQELVQMLGSQKVTLPFKDKPREISVLRAAHHFRSRLAIGVTNAVSSDDFDSALYYRVAPPLMSYGLAIFGKSPGSAAWQRVILSASGRRFLSEVEARTMTQDKAKQPEIDQTSSPLPSLKGQLSSHPASKSNVSKKRVKKKKRSRS